MNLLAIPFCAPNRQCAGLDHAHPWPEERVHFNTGQCLYFRRVSYTWKKHTPYQIHDPRVVSLSFTTLAAFGHSLCRADLNWRPA